MSLRLRGQRLGDAGPEGGAGGHAGDEAQRDEPPFGEAGKGEDQGAEGAEGTVWTHARSLA